MLYVWIFAIFNYLRDYNCAVYFNPDGSGSLYIELAFISRPFTMKSMMVTDFGHQHLKSFIIVLKLSPKSVTNIDITSF